MQVARNYVEKAGFGMENALADMSAPSRPSSLPTTREEITRYVEQLLTPEQEAVCDRATD